MTNNLHRIVSFVRREMTTSKPTGEVVRFELRHLPVGSKRGHEVLTVNVPEKTDSEWYEHTGAEIVASAENDAEGIASGPQRYVITVFRDKNPEKSQGRIALMIAADDADEEGEIESEPATKQGLMAQLMRHNEAKERIHQSSMAVMMQALQKMVGSLADENSRLREQRFNDIEAIEDLLSQRTDRDIAARKADAQIGLMQETGKKVAGLLPVVMNRMMGGKSDGQAMLVNNILGSLTEEQKTKLIEAFGSLDLNPEQQIAAGELLRSLNNH